MDDENLIELQSEWNKVIYETISDLYAESTPMVDTTRAIGLVVSSLATNLGIILAQLPDTARDHYFDAATKIIADSMITTIKHTSQVTWGQVGHA